MISRSKFDALCNSVIALSITIGVLQVLCNTFVQNTHLQCLQAEKLIKHDRTNTLMGLLQ
jgi:hypothetical protein